MTYEPDSHRTLASQCWPIRSRKCVVVLTSFMSEVDHFLVFFPVLCPISIILLYFPSLFGTCQYCVYCTQLSVFFAIGLA